VDFGSKTTGNVSFSSATTSGYQLINHGFTCDPTATVTHTQGTLNTNGQTCSWGIFKSTNSNTRTLTLGASAITLTSTLTPWDTTNSTGLTFNANTSSLTIAGSNSAGSNNLTATMNAGSLTYNTVIFATAGTKQFGALSGSSPTFANFTVTGSATTGAILSLGTSITVTTALTMNGVNANTNRLLVNSTAVGTQQTITNNGTGTFSNLDLQDINGAGSASWNLSAITGGSGDCLGNSGITFTTARTLFWVGNGSTWNTANKWATSSGGTANQSNPLAQDTITFDAGSFNGTGQTVSCSQPRLGKSVDFTNVTNSPTFSLAVASPAVTRMYGSLTLVPAMSMTGSSTIFFEGRGSSTFTTANLSLAANITMNGVGGTLNLSGNLTTTNNIALRAGTLSAGSANVTTPSFIAPGTITRVLNMGSGTWTANGTGFPWNTTAGASLTINAQTSTLVVSEGSIAQKTINGGNTFNILTITGDNIVLSGQNTIATLNINNAGQITGFKLAAFASGTTTITNTVTTNGSAGNLAILASQTPGSQTILTKSSGIVSVNYMNITDSQATGGAAWYAGANSTGASGHNNSGWIFTGPPSNLGLLGVG
jgi:hypothetical protein